MSETTVKKVMLCMVLVLLALLSFFFVAQKAASPDTHAATIASIDRKTDTVLKLTATSTLASAGISAIPGDTATPIAEKLADFTEYFLLILCVLYAEKYLLTLAGAAAFKVLIPCVCALLIAGLFWKPQKMKQLAVKLLVVALAIVLMIPLSIRVSDAIYRTYETSIDATIDAAEDFSNETSQLAEAKEDEGLLASIMDKLSETASTLSDKAAKTLNRFVESLAVMIVTACIIPLLVLVFFIWLVRTLLGKELNLSLPKRRRKPEEIEPNDEKLLP